MKFEVKQIINKSANGFRFPGQKTVAVCNTRKEAEDEAKRLKSLTAKDFIIDEINENGAARQLPKVMAKAA